MREREWNKALRKRVSAIGWAVCRLSVLWWHDLIVKMCLAFASQNSAVKFGFCCESISEKQWSLSLQHILHFELSTSHAPLHGSLVAQPCPSHILAQCRFWICPATAWDVGACRFYTSLTNYLVIEVFNSSKKLPNNVRTTSFKHTTARIVSLQRRWSSRPRRSPLRGPLAHRVVGAQLAGIIQPTTNQQSYWKS